MIMDKLHAIAPQQHSGKIACLSWIPILAETRRRLLSGDGYAVVSLLGFEGIRELESIGEVNLLVLAHSVPIEQKQRAVRLFKHRSGSPVLSLLAPHQSKLPDADYGIEAFSPQNFLDAVKQILRP